MREEYLLYDGNVKLAFEDEPKHKYEACVKNEDGTWTDWLWVPSVTGITGSIDDGKTGALMGWALNQAVGHLEQAWLPGQSYDEIEIKRHLKNAKYAHKKTQERAADIGSLVHVWVETYVKAQMEFGSGMPPKPHNPQARSGVDAFLKWDANHDVKYLDSERRVYSVRHHYSGTADIVAMVDNELTLIDIKTSSRADYVDYRLQTAAYVQAIEEETGQEIENRLIIHLSKDRGIFTVHDLSQEAMFNGATYDEDIKAFNAARQVYRRLKELHK